MNRRELLRAAGAVGLLGLRPAGAAAAAPERRKVTIAVGGKTSFFYLPFMLCERLGYFKDEGLEVESLDFPGGSRALQAVVGGSADVVSGAFDHTIELQPKGQFFRAFVLQGRTPTYALGVGKSRMAQVKTAADLRGMKIGVTAPGSSTHMFVNLVLSKVGLKPADVSIIGVGQGAQAMAAIRSGAIDALCISDPVITMLEQAGELRVLADARTPKGCTEVFGGLMPAGCLHAPEGFLQKNPNTVQALASAMVRTLRWIGQAGPSDISRAMPESFQFNDRKLYIDAFVNVRQTYSPDGRIGDEAARTAARALATIEPHIDPARLDYARLYTNEFVERAWKSSK
jgi:NitT/TauT family transport system substrate-binding protein